jgi:translation initiation factor IF-1
MQLRVIFFALAFPHFARAALFCSRSHTIAGDSFIRATAQGRRMAKQEAIEMEGIVTDVLAGARYRVKLSNGHIVLAYPAGKMMRFKIRVLVGDRVTMEVSPYDFSKGRITYRHKNFEPAPE